MKKIDQFLILLYKIIYILITTQIFMMIDSKSKVFLIILNIIFIYLLLMIDKTISFFMYIEPSYIQVNNKYITIILRLIGMFVSFMCILLISYLFMLELYSIISFLIALNIVFLLFDNRLFFDYISLKSYQRRTDES